MRGGEGRRGGAERGGDEWAVEGSGMEGGEGRREEEMRGQWRGVGGKGGEGQKDEHETVTTCTHPVVVILVSTHIVACFSIVY